MTRYNKYDFESRDYNILTNKPFALQTELPRLNKAPSVDCLGTQSSHRGVNIKNCNSVDYDPISKLRSSNATYGDAIKQPPKKRYLLTGVFEQSDLSSSRYRPGFEQFMDRSQGSFGFKKGVFYEYYGDCKNTHNKIFQKYRC